jgi:hypothetical protein
MASSLEAGSGPDHIVTHGICEACAIDVLADIEAVEERHVLGRYSPETLTSIDFSAFNNNRTRLG